MQEQINMVLLSIVLSPVVVKNSSNQEYEVLIPENVLVLLTLDKQALCIVTPLKEYDYSGIPKHHIVMDGLLYLVEKVLHRDKDEKNFHEFDGHE